MTTGDDETAQESLWGRSAGNKVNNVDCCGNWINVGWESTLCSSFGVSNTLGWWGNVGVNSSKSLNLVVWERSEAGLRQQGNDSGRSALNKAENGDMCGLELDVGHGGAAKILSRTECQSIE